MSKNRQIIHIHPDAALQPVPGAPCNGCGVCCLLEPCPLGVVLSGHREGACVAVRWHDELRQYRCGALCEPALVLQRVLPLRLQRLAPGLSARLAPLLNRWAGRWIAVGHGCDTHLASTEPAAPTADTRIH